MKISKFRALMTLERVNEKVKHCKEYITSFGEPLKKDYDDLKNLDQIVGYYIGYSECLKEIEDQLNETKNKTKEE